MSNLKHAGQRALTYTVAFATILWAAGLGALVPSASAATLTAGDLIKGSTASVYYYGSDGKRHAFTNDKAFKTWFADFSKVKTITDAELQTYMLGANVTYRPGTRLVKITTDPKVYAIEPGGALRPIASEQVAKDLYGDNWNKIIDDVADVFFPNYTVGAALSSAMPPVGTLMKTASSSDIYYVDSTGKRKFSDLNAFAMNGFSSANVRTVSQSVFDSVTAMGSAISGMEAGIATFMAPTGSTTPAPVSGSGLTVALASDTPAPMTVIADTANGGQGLASLAKFNFTAAADGDVTVTSLKLKREGVANDSDINNAYLYEGDMRLAEGPAINGGVITFTQSSGLFTVTKGTTKAVWVKFDVSKDATSGKQIGVSINAAADVMTSSTGVTVSGTFPMKGSLMSVATVTDLGKLTVATITPQAATTAEAMMDAELWKFSLAASNQNIAVSRLAMTNIGSTSATDIVNFKLMDGSTQVGTAVASMDSNKAVIFDLSSAPFLLNSGVTKQLSLRGDIKAGATRTYQFSFQKSSDVASMDKQYNVSLFPVKGADQTAAGTAGTWNVVQAAATTINSGTITVSKGSDSPTTEVVVSGTNVTLSTWDVTANGENVKVSTATFTPTISSTRTLKNVKLLFDGVQVGTTATTVTGGTNFSYTPGNSMIIPADGKSHKVALVGDTTGTATTNDTVLLTFAAGSSNGQGTASLSAVNVPGSATAANTVTLKSGTITPSRTGATSATFVKNTAKVSLGKWSLQAGSAENVDITSVTVKDSNSAGTANGGAGIGSAFNNLELWNVTGTTPVRIAQAIANPSATAGTTNVFNVSPSVLVSSTGPLTLELTGSVLSGATWTATNGIGITAISGTGKVTSTTVSYSATSPASTVGPAITVTTTGTLATSVDTSGAMAASFYTVGLTDQEFARLRLTSTNEDIKISKLVLQTTNGTANVDSLKLVGTGLGTDPVATVDANGKATFNFSSNDQLMIAKDASKVITVKGMIGGLDALIAGKKGLVRFGEVDATGASSGTVIQEHFGGTAGTNYYVAGTDAYSGDLGDVIYFTATADAGTNTASGYYMVTTDDDAVNLATGDLDLNGEATDTSWTAGDVIVKLTKTFADDSLGSTAGALAVGDVVYFHDVSAVSNSGFYIVSTPAPAGTDLTNTADELGLGLTGVTYVAGDIITKITSANALSGNVMQFEEVEPVVTLNSAAPSGTQTPGQDKVVAILDIKAMGGRDMTFSSLNVLMSGSNEAYVNVPSFKLYDGTGTAGTKLAEATRLAAATTADAGGTYTITGASTSLKLCNTADGAGANQELNVGAGLAAGVLNKIPLGGKITVRSTSANYVTYTVVKSATGSACTGTGNAGDVTLTLASGADTGAAISDDNSPTIYGHNVIFDANSTVALSSQTITQNTTKTVAIVADTTNVKSGVTSGTVTYGISLPGTAGPLTDAYADDTTQQADGGLTWTYTVKNTAGTSHTGATADNYPVSANTLSY